MSSAIDDLRTWFMDMHHTSPHYHDMITMNQMFYGIDDESEKSLIARFHRILQKLSEEQAADMAMLRTAHKKRTDLLIKVNRMLVDLEGRPPQNTSMNEILSLLRIILDDLKD